MIESSARETAVAALHAALSGNWVACQFQVCQFEQADLDALEKAVDRLAGVIRQEQISRH